MSATPAAVANTGPERLFRTSANEVAIIAAVERKPRSRVIARGMGQSQLGILEVIFGDQLALVLYICRLFNL